MNSNRATLGKYFQRELDTTPLDYVRRRRIDYAAEQLRRGQKTVEEVAANCGYSSVSYFSRVLNQITGCRPGALRRGTCETPADR
jgi:AraC-like DNA-binding protein